MFVTNTDRVRSELEHQIVSGVLSPGSALDETQLGKAFDVSRTPIREALLQLSAQGYVRIVPRAGIYVSQLSAGELCELFEALAFAESLCARLACQRITAAQLKRLNRLQEVGRSALDANDSDAYVEYNRQFHDCFYSSSGNSHLAAHMLHIQKRTSAYRMKLAEQGHERHEASWSEHQALLDALVEGDEEAAMKAAHTHVIRRTRSFRDMAEISPDHCYFPAGLDYTRGDTFTSSSTCAFYF